MAKPELTNSLKATGRGLPPIRKEYAGPMQAQPSYDLGGQGQRLPWIVPAAQVRWLGPGVAFYTPQRIEQLFRQALSGDLQSQWECFDMMECTWPELSKCLAELKDDVLANELRVEPFKQKGEEPSDDATDRASLVEECLCSMTSRPECDENDWEDTIRHIMDARGKGISVEEVMWETRALPSGRIAVAPRCTRWVHPAWYGYEFGPGDADLKLRPGPYSISQSTVITDTRSFVDFPDHRFIIGICKNRTGHPLGAAMLWVLGFAWAASNLSAEWFLNFAQVFGQPIRWATYAATMTPGDQATLANILQNMGSAAWAMFPEGTQFDLKEAMAKGSDNVQHAVLEWADKQCQKVVLRQVLASDINPSGGSRSAGEVHERILDGVKLALAKWACKSLQTLIQSICLLNFGDLNECPYLVPAKDEDEDPSELAETLKTLADAGLEPTDDELPDLGERLGIEVQRKAVTTMDPDSDNDSNATGLEAKSVTAIARAKHPADVIADRKASALALAFRGRYTPLRRILLEAKSAEEAIERAQKFFPDLKADSIAGIVEEGMQIAAAAAAAK